MRAKLVIGTIITLAGCALALRGMIIGSERIIDAGIGGLFLGAVLLSFSAVDQVKLQAFTSVVESYVRILRGIFGSLELSGLPVVIPPYENLPRGAVFIPLHEEFELDLARFDENTTLLMDIGREREMGVLMPGFGSELLEIYEAYLESDMRGVGISGMEAVSSALRSLGIARSLSFERNGNELTVKIEGVKCGACSDDCIRSPCPICSSIALAASKAFDEVIVIKEMKVRDKTVEMVLEMKGGVGSWM